jgi:hypothetical protein
VETWNELHEGTEICETRELGRKYIELTREYVDILKLPDKEREEEVESLLTFYYKVVTLDPAEVWQVDLEGGEVEFPLYVTSHGRNLYGHLSWNDAGTDVEIDPGEDDFTLIKWDVLRLDYTVLQLDEKTLMGRLPYVEGAFAVDGRDRPVSFRLELSLIRRVDCHPATGEITIDGNLSDWAGKQALIVAQAANTGGPAAPYPFENSGAGYQGWHPGDASMEIYSCWDAENLYLAVGARDDIPLDGLRKRDMLNGDCIQIGMELDDDRDGTFDGEGDMEFAMTKIEGNDRFHTFRRPGGLSGPLDGIIRYAIERIGNLTIYEMSIPILEFGIDEEDWDEGYSMGLNIVMHDDDGNSWEGFIQLSPGLVYAKDTRRFARLILVE